MDTLQRSDSIDSSGFPLGFKVRQGSARPAVIGAAAGMETFRVELRAMGGHQKEAVLTEGASGSVYRAVSDEGVGLKGTDLAPFPLGFFNAAFQSEIQHRVMQAARLQGVRIDAIASEALHVYAFEGSLGRGDGRGSAQAPRVKLHITSSAPAAQVHTLVRAALDASPLVALARVPVESTFALYVNGIRRVIARPTPSKAMDAPDPLKVWKGIPTPLAGANDLPGMIVKLAAAAPPSAPTPHQDPNATTRREIHNQGIARWVNGIAECETWNNLGSRFAIKGDNREDRDQAPSSLGLGALGIAFCLSTQFLRYADVHKMNLRALRIVQDAPFEVVNEGGVLKALAHPLDTHIFLHGEESDERMEKLLVMSQNTCFLHGLLAHPRDPVVEVELNGGPLAA